MQFSLRHGLVHKLIFLCSLTPSLPPLSITSSLSFLCSYGNTVLYVSFSNETVLSDFCGCHNPALPSPCRWSATFLLLCISCRLNTGQSISDSLETTNMHSQCFLLECLFGMKISYCVTTWLDGASVCPCVCGVLV